MIINYNYTKKKLIHSQIKLLFIDLNIFFPRLIHTFKLIIFVLILNQFDTVFDIWCWTQTHLNSQQIMATNTYKLSLWFENYIGSRGFNGMVNVLFVLRKVKYVYLRSFFLKYQNICSSNSSVNTSLSIYINSQLNEKEKPQMIDVIYR